jgi:hypothetical protein
MRVARTVVGVGAIALSLVVACGSGNSTTCSAGDLKSCACADGSPGTATCGANGAYAACVCTGDGGGDASSEAGGNVPYMSLCTQVGNPGDCAAPDECFDFPNRGMYCTHPCSGAQDCAAPSTGCNGMGVCKAPDALNDGGMDGAG